MNKCQKLMGNPFIWKPLDVFCLFQCQIWTRKHPLARLRTWTFFVLGFTKNIKHEWTRCTVISIQSPKPRPSLLWTRLLAFLQVVSKRKLWPHFGVCKRNHSCGSACKQTNTTEFVTVLTCRLQLGDLKWFHFCSPLGIFVCIREESKPMLICWNGKDRRFVFQSWPNKDAPCSVCTCPDKFSRVILSTWAGLSGWQASLCLQTLGVVRLWVWF